MYMNSKWCRNDIKEWRYSMLTLIIVYIVISIMIAIHTIRDWQKKEDELAYVPYGDLEYYDTESMFRYYARHFIFFPSIMIIKGWIRFCKYVNSKI